MIKILFVCTRNKFRSQAAEIIAKGLASRNRAWVKSSGISDKEYEVPVPKKVRDLLETWGYSIPGNKRSQPTTEELVRWADKISYMQPSHRKVLLEKFGDRITEKLVFLGDFSGLGISRIPDPAFAKDKRDFKRIMRLIEECVENMLMAEGAL